MGPAFVRKYNTAITAGTIQSIKIPMIKRGVADFAIGADWTPVAGDVKVSKDGGAAANIATLPAAVAMGNGAYWEFVFSNTELTCGSLQVTISDSSTKAVEDNAFLIETCGNASAMYKADLTATAIDSNLIQVDGLATVTGAAVLNLKQLNIINSTGSALVLTSTGSNGYGAIITGHGTAHGAYFKSGSSGFGDGARFEAMDQGAGLKGIGGPNNIGSGIAGVGGLSGGDGISGTGYGAGAGLAVTGGNQTGLLVVAEGGPGIDCKSITGHGMQFWGGKSVAGTTGKSGMQLRAALTINESTGAGTTTALDAAGFISTGSGAREGIFSLGGPTGDGASFLGGATSGNGASFTGQTSGHGISNTPTGTSKYGMSGTLEALKTTLADSVPADGTRPTVEQALYMITQFLMERSVSSTTLTVKKADGSTSLMTFTLNDATNPTSITRAT